MIAELTFSKVGDMVFISHHDLMRLFSLALVRGEFPLKYAGKYNPKPKLSLAIPLSVGIESAVEVLYVELTETAEIEQFARSFNEQLPEGLRVTSARMLYKRPKVTDYEVHYTAYGAAPSLSENPDKVLSAESVVVRRKRKDEEYDFEARPYVFEISANGDDVRFVLKVTSGGTVKPEELLRFLGVDVDADKREFRLVRELVRECPQAHRKPVAGRKGHTRNRR